MDILVFKIELGEWNVLYVMVFNGDVIEFEFNDFWIIVRLMIEIKKVMKINIDE